MKILVLTSDTPANVWLVNEILDRYQVVGMVVERPALAITAKDKIERRRRMVRRHGLLRTLNKLLYNRYRSRFLASKSAALVREAFFPGGEEVKYRQDVPTLEVPGINDPRCIDFIERLAPDVLAVCGTTVIRPEVFTLAPKGAVNIHTGITPEYRSADPIFWALYRGEPHQVGVTIHFIDQGIDTGPVILQERVPVYSDDSLDSIYVRCIRRGAELYCRALAAIGDGSVRTLDRSDAKSFAFRSIDLGILQYVRFRFRFRRIARKLGGIRPAAVAVGGEMDR